MTEQRDYGSILNVVIETAKTRGMQSPGSDFALACYQIIEAARSEALVWGVPQEEIGLLGFDAQALLGKRAA